MSYAKLLGKEFGGSWRYDGCTTWWCDDGRRHVARTASDFYDDGDRPGPPTYYLYEDGHAPRIVRFALFSDIDKGEG